MLIATNEWILMEIKSTVSVQNIRNIFQMPNLKMQ